MRRQAGRIVIALVLILFGTAALLDSLGIIDLPTHITGANLIWTLLFGISSAAFLVAFFAAPENWWAIIPGLTLLGLTLLVGGLIPPAIGELGGAVFMGCIALSFWLVYLRNRENWWAIIPGGVLLSLTGLIAVSSFLSNEYLPVAVFFLGMAATFLLVYILPKPIGKPTWPLFPAAALGLMGIAFLFAVGQMVNWLVGLAMVAAGGWIIWRSFRR
jgi:hypothetical protein